MDEKLFEKIAREVESGYGMGGLSSGLYYDFALECCKRYLNTVAQEPAISSDGELPCLCCRTGGCQAGCACHQFVGD